MILIVLRPGLASKFHFETITLASASDTSPFLLSVNHAPSLSNTRVAILSIPV